MERSDRASAVTFFSPDAFTAGVPVTLGDDAAQHARVLRIGAGASAELRDGQGNAARGSVSRIAKRSVTIDVTEVWSLPEFPPVHLLVPVADRDRMLVLAEKCAELATTSWRPVIWRRSRSVGPAGDGPAFQSRLKGRMIAALTQSGGGWLPEVHPSAPVSRAIAAAPQGTRLLCDARAERGLIDVDMQLPVSIAIGPEGGLDEKERDEMIEGGFTPVSLVGGTLRFETAGVAALAIIRARLGRGQSGQRSSSHPIDQASP